MDETMAKAIAGQLRKPDGEEGIKTANWMNKGNVWMNRDAFRALAATAHDHILEIGMGNGFFVQEIVSRHPSIKYTGVDFSPTMIDEATRLNRSWIDAGQASFVLSGADSLPFGDDTFTKIFTVNTLYFWEDEKRVLEELKRVLKTGGKLIIAIRPRRLMAEYPFTQYGFRLYSTEELIALFSANGFTDIQSFEHQEPAYEHEGEKIVMENVVVTGVTVHS